MQLHLDTERIGEIEDLDDYESDDSEADVSPNWEFFQMPWADSSTVALV